LGLIETVADNVPRLDYFATDGTVGCPALLVEPSGTNLATNSNLFSVETAPVATVVQNQVDIFGNPDSAWLLSGASSNNDSPTANNVRKITSATVSGSTYAGTIYIKSPTGAPVTFNIRHGVTTTSTVASGDGWFRAVNVSVTTTQYRAIFYTNGGAPIIICHHQVELGSVPTSYIGPVAGTALTRNADVVSVSGAVSGSIGQTQGTIYLDLTVLGKGSSSATRWVQIFGPSNNIGLAINSSNLFRSIVNTQSDTLLTAPLISSGVKVAWAYDATGTTCFINGTQYTLTTGGNQTMSSLTSISIDGSANTAFGFARIRAAALYPTRLTNTQLALLTSPYTSYSSMASALSYTLG
jgi:hypothetical protein